MSKATGDNAVPVAVPAEAFPEVPATDDTPGARLAAARRREKLTVIEVAGRLRIRPALVEAMERNDFAALGARPYQHGQVRNYARLVGLSETEVLAAMDAGTPMPAPPVRRRKPPGSTSPGTLVRLTAWCIVTVVLVLGVLWAYRQYTPNSYPVPEAAGPTPQPQAVPTYSGDEALPIPLPPPGSSAPTPTPSEVAAPEAGNVSKTTPPLSGAPHLVLSFTAPCWVEVSDASGARLLYRMARAGDRHELSGTPPYAIMLGNAAAADISYNGAPVAKPAGLKSILRFSVGG